MVDVNRPGGRPSGRRESLPVRFWRGREKLWKAYWLVGVVGGWLFASLVKHLALSGWLSAVPAIGLLAVYSLFSAVAIWRSAFNTGWRGWGYIARAVIVLSAVLFVAGLAGFLE